MEEFFIAVQQRSADMFEGSCATWYKTLAESTAAMPCHRVLASVPSSSETAPLAALGRVRAVSPGSRPHVLDTPPCIHQANNVTINTIQPNPIQSNPIQSISQQPECDPVRVTISTCSSAMKTKRQSAATGNTDNEKLPSSRISSSLISKHLRIVLSA